MIRFIPATGSTNADLLSLGAEWREGDWLVARRQTGGRGRAGRDWHDGAGNFMGSTVVQLRLGDPPAQTLALVTGLGVWSAVCAACGRIAGLQLKWPNDLLVARAKLAGILLERTGDTVVAGVGVNLARAPQVAARETIALADLGEDVLVDSFADELAGAFTLLLGRWRAGEWGQLRREWLAAAHPEGTQIEVKDRDGAAIRGTFAGLDADGAALLRLADGTVRPIHAGDVELVGQA